MCKGEKQVLKENLEIMCRNGVALFLEGEPSTPGEIIGKCVGEDSMYMADYVLNEEGYLTELRYDLVSVWK
ncbi:MAG: hypothetical protein IJ282_01825 [Lachnospiraceae bacterium]|nr:hypothetical protein [Lachnospiraceae bacterium]